MKEGWSLLISQWEALDLFKILFSLVAGLIFGVERELKDKSAGLKTITIICLGSTVFTLLSYKMGAGNSEDSTRIASYVVSGIGFLGAGVIFKNKYSVKGLTTAAIIWASAAVGMAIGFGEFFIALNLLIVVSVVLLSGSFISNVLFDNKVTRSGYFIIKKDDFNEADGILKFLNTICINADKRSVTLSDEIITINIELLINKKNYNQLENYFLTSSKIIGFSI